MAKTGTRFSPDQRWDKELSFDEQELLVFTRVLLHKPHCVVIDEALDILDDDARQCIIGLFNGEIFNDRRGPPRLKPKEPGEGEPAGPTPCI